MRFTAVLLACAASVLAVDYAEWCQHNGLVTTYNRILKEHGEIPPLVDQVADGDVTAFVPTNSAMKTWLDANPSLSYKTIDDTFRYMVVTGGSYKLSDLATKNGKMLPTLLKGQSIRVMVEGASPDFKIVLQSGTKLKTNSTAGIANQDFSINNGHVQLVDTVFQLPKSLRTKDQQSKVVNAAPKASLGAGLLVSVLGMAAMALL